MTTIRSARVCSSVLMGVVVVVFSWPVLPEGGVQAADDPKSGSPTPKSEPLQAASATAKSPPVFLSRGGPDRTGSVSGSRLPEHPVVLWTKPLSDSPASPCLPTA